MTPVSLSATILLLRETQEGLEVFMLKRHRKIEFAGGALVFPGGKVDAHDQDPQLLDHCNGTDNLSPLQRTTRIAAIREAFEESGLFLARKADGNTMLSAEEVDAMASQRILLQQEKLSLLSLLQEKSLSLALDELHDFAHWITPKMAPKRYDTHFFLAAAPPDQKGLHDGKESVESFWIRPQDALQKSEQGEYTIIFPTRMNLMRLAKANNIAEAIAQAKAQPIVTIEPWFEDGPEGPVLCIPANAGYDQTQDALARVLKEEGFSS